MVVFVFSSTEGTLSIGYRYQQRSQAELPSTCPTVSVTAGRETLHGLSGELSKRSQGLLANYINKSAGTYSRKSRHLQGACTAPCKSHRATGWHNGVATLCVTSPPTARLRPKISPTRQPLTWARPCQQKTSLCYGRGTARNLRAHAPVGIPWRGVSSLGLPTSAYG